MTEKIVFIDRDGTINEDRGYVYKISDFILLPGVMDALKRLTLANVLIYIITNQSGIARGCYTEEDFFVLTEYMKNLFKKNNIAVNDVLYCPHHPRARIKKYRKVCACRKPANGLIRGVMEKCKVSPDNAAVIGDKNSDIDAGNSLGLRTYLVESGFDSQAKMGTKASYVVADLQSAVAHVLSAWGLA